MVRERFGKHQPLFQQVICMNTCGLKQVNKCMLMVAVAYSLKKAMKFKVNKPRASVMTLPLEAQDFIRTVFFRLQFSILSIIRLEK